MKLFSFVVTDPKYAHLSAHSYNMGALYTCHFSGNGICSPFIIGPNKLSKPEIVGPLFGTEIKRTKNYDYLMCQPYGGIFKNNNQGTCYTFDYLKKAIKKEYFVGNENKTSAFEKNFGIILNISPDHNKSKILLGRKNYGQNDNEIPFLYESKSSKKWRNILSKKIPSYTVLLHSESQKRIHISITYSDDNDMLGSIENYDRDLNLVSYIKIQDGTQKQYFGYSGVIGDFNKDGCADLAIGAPFFTEMEDEGIVYIFICDDTTLDYTNKIIVLKGSREQSAMFGSSIVEPYDLNFDRFMDLIILAPFANNLPSKIFIYMGTSSGISHEYTQMISSLDQSGHNINNVWRIFFGLDADGNNFPDIGLTIPTKRKVEIIRSIPFIQFKITNNFTRSLNYSSISTGCFIYKKNKKCFQYVKYDYKLDFFTPKKYKVKNPIPTTYEFSIFPVGVAYFNEKETLTDIYTHNIETHPNNRGVSIPFNLIIPIQILLINYDINIIAKATIKIKDPSSCTGVCPRNGVYKDSLTIQTSTSNCTSSYCMPVFSFILIEAKNKNNSLMNPAEATFIFTVKNSSPVKSIYTIFGILFPTYLQIDLVTIKRKNVNSTLKLFDSLPQLQKTTKNYYLLEEGLISQEEVILEIRAQPNPINFVTESQIDISVEDPFIEGSKLTTHQKIYYTYDLKANITGVNSPSEISNFELSSISTFYSEVELNYNFQIKYSGNFVINFLSLEVHVPTYYEGSNYLLFKSLIHDNQTVLVGCENDCRSLNCLDTCSTFYFTFNGISKYSFPFINMKFIVHPNIHYKISTSYTSIITQAKLIDTIKYRTISQIKLATAFKTIFSPANQTINPWIIAFFAICAVNLVTFLFIGLQKSDVFKKLRYNSKVHK